MTDWTWPGTVVTKIIDGDTLDAVLTRDVGFGIRTLIPVRLRLGRVNAPKGSSPTGRAATAALVDLVPLAVPLGLVTTGPYKFGGPVWADGEWMTEIEVPSGNVSDIMVKSGNAVYWDGEGPRPNDGRWRIA